MKDFKQFKREWLKNNPVGAFYYYRGKLARWLLGK